MPRVRAISAPQARISSLQCLPVLADMLRQARRKRGWGVLHLSKRSGAFWSVIEQIESPSCVPSEGNTALLAETLRVPVGPLLAERDRLVERLRDRPCEAAKESRVVST